MVTDVDGRIVDANPAVSAITGYAREEILGSTPALWQAPEDASRLVRSMTDQFARNGFWRGDIRLRRKNGEERIADVTALPLRDEEGRTVGTVSVNRDITEAIRAEQRIGELSQELTHLSRVSDMGEMAASVAHELNQPLAAISNYVQGCLRRVRSGASDLGELIPILERVGDQARRASEIVRRIRRFVQKKDFEHEAVDLGAAIGETVELLRGESLRHATEIVLEIDPQCPTIVGDGLQIQQVVINLARNAMESMSEADCAQRILTIRARPHARGGVEVEVADGGPGVPDSVRERLFEPFFTTKGAGLGMGLVICRSIVRGHGGDIAVSSGANGGAVFSFTLPGLAQEG
jgi:two-component system, LuxR family, sensor kinase FixL